MVAAWLREIGVDFVPLPPAAEAPGESLEEIRDELLACRGCALCSGRRTVVFGTGNPKARLMFVGEGPGEEEDRQGEPFVGAAGKRLDRWIARIGLARDQVYIANIVKCRPPATGRRCRRRPPPAFPTSGARSGPSGRTFSARWGPWR